MDQIVLIRPPILELKANLSSYGAIPPIGLAYIAASLQAAGHVVKVIDAPGEAIHKFYEIQSPVGTVLVNGLNSDEIVERIPTTAQYVGITHMFLHEWPIIKETAVKIKNKNPNCKIILGGENVTAFWSWIFKDCEAIDYCVLGEGEATIVRLIDHLANVKTAAIDFDGVATRDHLNSTIQPSLPTRQSDLNLIAWPAWSLFPIENYLQVSDHHGVHRGRSMPILATRGCPFRCTFCSSPQMWTTKYYTREPSDVVQEMKLYIEKYQVENFNFCDLTAIIDKNWIVQFCHILLSQKLNITWQLPTGTRSEALDEEVLTLLYQTGCRNITYAPESGSVRMLKILRKKVQLPRMIESLKQAKKAKMITRINIIIGHPAEIRFDWWSNLKFILRCAVLGVNDIAVMIFAPYPGSEDFKNLLNEKRLNFDASYSYMALARSGTSTLSYNKKIGIYELLFLQYFFLIAFYATAYLAYPYRWLSLLKSIFSGQEETQLDQLIRTRLQRLKN